MSRPNLLRQPIDKDDITEYLADADDFRLEVDVFRACLAAGFQAEHGGTYKDPVTGVNRQFDVRAQREISGRFLKLAIECKALADFFPLVVSRMPRLRSERDYHALVSVPGAGGPRYDLFSMRMQGLFPAGQPVGKSTNQIGRKDQRPSPGQKSPLTSSDSEVHEKWAQAIASAHDLVAESVTDYKRSEMRWAASLILPVLVVANGTLWAVDYDAEGNVSEEPKRVEECSIYLNSRIEVTPFGFPVGYPVSHLLVYTKDGFIDMLRRFSNAGMIEDSLLPDFQEVETLVTKKFGDLGQG